MMTASLGTREAKPPGHPSRRRHRRTIATVLATVAIVAATAGGLTACSSLGGFVNQQLSAEGNLANQRKVAVQLVQDYPSPDLTTIKFTNEGHVDGGGSWGANAIVTVNGKDYNAILGTSLSLGDRLPTLPPGSTHGPVTLIYSDGTSEVLE